MTSDTSARETAASRATSSMVTAGRTPFLTFVACRCILAAVRALQHIGDIGALHSEAGEHTPKVRRRTMRRGMWALLLLVLALALAGAGCSTAADNGGGDDGGGNE